jgi:AraC family transcriptional regulator
VGAKGRAWGELTELTLGQGVFARTRHVGDYDAIQESIDALYAHVLERPDREIGSAPLFIHYLDDPEETAVEDLRSYIYLPLKPDAGASSPVL